MVDYTRAIKRPFSDIKSLLIGTVIKMIPIVNLIAVGYQLNCAKSAMKKKFALPEWTEWSDLFVKGLMIVVAGIVYVIPATVVMVVGLGASIAGGGLSLLLSGSPENLAASLVGMGVSAIAAVVLGVAAMYLMPSAILNFAKGGKFENLFALKTIYRKAVNVEYLKVWVFTAVYTVVITVVLSIVPTVGTFLGAFAASVTSYTLFGEVYEKL